MRLRPIEYLGGASFSTSTMYHAYPHMRIAIVSCTAEIGMQSILGGQCPIRMRNKSLSVVFQTSFKREREIEAWQQL